MIVEITMPIEDDTLEIIYSEDDISKEDDNFSEPEIDLDYDAHSHFKPIGVQPDITIYLHKSNARLFISQKLDKFYLKAKVYFCEQLAIAKLSEHDTFDSAKAELDRIKKLMECNGLEKK